MTDFGLSRLTLPQRRRANVAGVLALLLGATSGMTLAAGAVGVVTILDGEATLLRERDKLTLAEGVRVAADDIIELGAKGRFLRIEFSDGASLGLGPDTRVQLLPRLAPERGRPAPRLYLLSGWAKLGAAPSTATALATPWFGVSTLTGAGVFAVQADGALAFAESGDLTLRPLRPQPGAPIGLKSGELLSLGGNAKPQLLARPSASFTQAVPKTFLDNLPARSALFQAKQTDPKPIGAVAYADVQAWIDAEPALRKANLARWKPLAANPQFRKGLLADMKAHPEWRVVLFPPEAASSPQAGSAAPHGGYAAPRASAAAPR
ncbi:MAG: hypothetical protein ACRC2B_06780 [Rubrivivax sp.]